VQTAKLQKENQELEFVLDMYGQENYDKRYADLNLLKWWHEFLAVNLWGKFSYKKIC